MYFYLPQARMFSGAEMGWTKGIVVTVSAMSSCVV